MERILDLGVEGIGQFVGEPAAQGLVHERLDGGDERAVTREPHVLVGPEASVVEADSFPESIVAPAMSITGQVVEDLEFAKDGEIGCSAKDLFEFGQGGDFMPQQVLAEDLGVEGERSHNVIVPTTGVVDSEL